ncbi:hypothetical protein [Pseudarthrobacter phenanthrenivorans]|uniref:hypothetical protein n=1 Tax=Pseudarthrobacter phenanthrenivorans TaxID=361575 RepID=UPI000B2F5101|nr:hypothetical protein [Pseudarthrobacter phenanthrenivorans]
MRSFFKARPGWSVAVVLLSAAFLAGCTPQPETGQPAPSSPGTATAPMTPTPTPPPSQVPSPAPVTEAGNPAAAWTTFTTADGTMAFDLPSAWRVKDPAGELAEGGGAFAEVRNQAGKVMATLRTNMATGSTCTERYPYDILDTADIPVLVQDGVVPQFVFETRKNSAARGTYRTPAAGYGITSGPAASGPDACPIFQFFRWPPNAAMFGASYDPGNNATPGDPSLPYLDLAKKYRDTAEYADIRRMITSLRPANR